MDQTSGGICRSDGADPSARVLSPVSQQIQSDRAGVGDLGNALEWHAVDRLGNSNELGQDNDLEWRASPGSPDRQDLRKGCDAGGPGMGTATGSVGTIPISSQVGCNHSTQVYVVGM